MKNMILRAIKAALLNRSTFREVGQEPGAVLYSLGTVMLAGIAIGLGLMGVVTEGAQDPADLGKLADRLLGGWMALIATIVGWILWSGVIYLLGTIFLGGSAGYRQIVRALGISYGPGVLLVMYQLPVVGPVATSIGLLWVLVAGVVAVHEVQQVDWAGAFLSTLLGWFVFFFMLIIVLEPFIAGS